MTGRDVQPCDRRRFLSLCACTMAGSMLVAGCASLAVRQVEPTDGRLRLPLLQYPELTEDGGALTIVWHGQEHPVFVLALGGQRFAALSPICTHLGCTVEIQGERLVCPCHGSTYDRQGRVLRGPAERALEAYPLRVTADGVIEVDLTRGAA